MNDTESLICPDWNGLVSSGYFLYNLVYLLKYNRNHFVQVGQIITLGCLYIKVWTTLKGQTKVIFGASPLALNFSPPLQNIPKFYS